MRKSGAKHSRLAVIPLNAKSTRNEIKERAALTALMAGCATEQHVVDLYILADLCEDLTKETHIVTHARSVKRMCNELQNRAYLASTLQAMSMTASADILINWIKVQQNKRIADAAKKKMSSVING